MNANMQTQLSYIQVQYQPRSMIRPTQYSTRANNSNNKNSKHTPMKTQKPTILGKFYELKNFNVFSYCTVHYVAKRILNT